jgi:hypothetical protein
MSTSDTASISKNWEYYQEAGCCGSLEDFVELVGFFYTPQFSVVLKPPRKTEARQIRDEIFWQQIRTVHFTANVHSAVSLTLGNALYETGSKLSGSIGGIWSFRNLHLKESIRQRFFDLDIPDTLAHILSENLFKCISLSTGYLALGIKNSENKMRPLLDRWKTGNHPIGLSANNDLLLLCCHG